MAPKAPQTDSTGIPRNHWPSPSKTSPQKPKQNPPRPTHFLSLPLGHHSGLRERISELHEKLLPPRDTAAPIEGLDRSILVDPRRLHLTIGVMVLSSTESSIAQPNTSGSSITAGKTVSEAIALLQSLGPEIDAITGQPVLLTLDKMGVLKTKREQAGVLYVGPSDEFNEDTAKVTRIFDLVGQKFRQEGFIEEAVRPAVLHCTLINASHRKPRRIPRTFSYQEIFDRARAKSSETPLEQSLPQDSSPRDKYIRVDFGAWAVSEIQLCRMGSHGPENEYISLASVPIGGN
ncbi:hypothetical protein K438DRAFT_1770341 [Mycena galopus ATCC 62051]|nr:hypothetical protein K438DRAFT_1770341 [Mycena galopus ATCC 62051]